MKQDPLRAVLDALDVATGPALVLDGALLVVAASPAAAALLGRPVPPGASAPALLCGDGPKRPVADALAEGRAVRATVPLPGQAGRLLTVRSIPFAAGAGARPAGWLLLLEDAGAAGEGVVDFHGMLSRDGAMKQLFHLIDRVAADDATVLVRGETGTGKELVAQALHAASPRRRAPLRAVNCAALPATLLEAELFGVVKGAFTGALHDTPGLLRSAHKGTLFLDEVAELPLELQAKLLRVLETRQVVPVGGHEPVSVDVRIVSATHRALRQEVAAGRFRADLLYRLRVIPLVLPPLRDRRGDVAVLVRAFVDELNGKNRRRHVEAVAPAALAALERWPWPGNVRELRNVLQYAFAMGDGPVLTAAELPPELFGQAGVDADVAEGDEDDDGGRPRAPASSATPASSLAPERAVLQRALDDAGGNRDEAAVALGVSRVTLWRWMKAAGLPVRRRRA